jgi:hypothetical protein
VVPSEGWERRSFDASEVAIKPHDLNLDAIFRPLDPPHEPDLMRR